MKPNPAQPLRLSGRSLWNYDSKGLGVPTGGNLSDGTGQTNAMVPSSYLINHLPGQTPLRLHLTVLTMRPEGPRTDSRSSCSSGTPLRMKVYFLSSLNEFLLSAFPSTVLCVKK
jgi:hypothetical protein